MHLSLITYQHYSWSPLFSFVSTNTSLTTKIFMCMNINNYQKLPAHAHICMYTCRQVADTGLDYVAISSSLVFEEGVTSMSFNLSLLEDSTPETDEYIFIAITNVQLNQSSVDVVDPGALPSVAPANDSVAFIVISENDDARGVVELSGSQVETPEPSQDFISVIRQAGTFGEVRSLLANKAYTRILLRVGGCLAKDSGLAYVYCCSKTFLVWYI